LNNQVALPISSLRDNWQIISMKIGRFSFPSLCETARSYSGLPGKGFSVLSLTGLPTKPLVITAVIRLAFGIAGAAEPNLSYLTGSLAKDEPQAIYAADPQDCWNRIFHCLFTRTLQVRLSSDFAQGAPFTSTNESVMGANGVSTRLFERIESGDRAVEPLYPHEMFRDAVGTAQLLAEPRFSEFKAALSNALAESSARLPLQRALMQSDVWAAYDFMVQDVSNWILPSAPIPLFHERQVELRKLLAEFIRKLALTEQEIRALPDNYVLAKAAHGLPDLFGTNSPWLEVLWLSDRMHERAAHGRRVARVFVKPAIIPADKGRFLNRAPHDQAFYRKLEAVALVAQDLLITGSGKVVPSPLTYSVQIRTFGQRRRVGTQFAEYELSRRELLKNPLTGGLKSMADLPAYLPDAGNDYGFASRIGMVVPVAVSLGSRCIACHGPGGIRIFTFDQRPSAPVPPVKILKSLENEHGWWLAGQKMKAKSFKALAEHW
jgi:hypothetical protein